MILPPYSGWWCGIIFFGLIMGMLGWDWYLWNQTYDSMSLWMRIIRWPGTMLFMGLLNGVLVFPQRGYHLQPF